MIKVCFFAQFRELLGIGSCDLAPDNINSVSDVISQLTTQINGFSDVIGSEKALCAVNQTIVNQQHIVEDGDEVAFFPPVTGG